jgi:hypothetical protein
LPCYPLYRPATAARHSLSSGKYQVGLARRIEGKNSL